MHTYHNCLHLLRKLDELTFKINTKNKYFVIICIRQRTLCNLVVRIYRLVGLSENRVARRPGFIETLSNFNFQSFGVSFEKVSRDGDMY